MQTLAAVSGDDEVIGSRFRGRVGTSRIESIGFEGTFRSNGQIAIDLVGRDLQKAINTAAGGRVEQHLYTLYIGMDERLVINKAPIDMALRSEIDNDTASIHGCMYGIRVGDVASDECQLALKALQIRLVAAVGQQIEYSN